jgi:hypothetical protein
MVQKHILLCQNEHLRGSYHSKRIFSIAYK